MPVFNTGQYLEEAIASVLGQASPFSDDMPSYELLLIDDQSTDPLTLEILDRHGRTSPHVRLMKNQRGKGAAGARNTGIVSARGKWIGFLDSDDYWFPHALTSRWRFIQANPSVTWVAAHFYLLTAERGLQRDPLSRRAPTLYRMIKSDYERAIPSRLEKPVALFAKYCAVGIHTVLLRRDLMLAKGMFDESLVRSEDYQLWFKCAVDQDLWLVPEDIAVYRLRPGSLTRRKEPVFFHEHRMLELLLSHADFAPHADLLKARMNMVLGDYCYYYRREKKYGEAIRWAAIWIRKAPTSFGAWKQLIAAGLRR